MREDKRRGQVHTPLRVQIQGGFTLPIGSTPGGRYRPQIRRQIAPEARDAREGEGAEDEVNGSCGGLGAEHVARMSAILPRTAELYSSVAVITQRPNLRQRDTSTCTARMDECENIHTNLRQRDTSTIGYIG